MLENCGHRYNQIVVIHVNSIFMTRGCRRRVTINYFLMFQLRFRRWLYSVEIFVYCWYTKYSFCRLRHFRNELWIRNWNFEQNIVIFKFHKKNTNYKKITLEKFWFAPQKVCYVILRHSTVYYVQENNKIVFIWSEYSWNTKFCTIQLIQKLVP